MNRRHTQPLPPCLYPLSTTLHNPNILPSFLFSQPSVPLCLLYLPPPVALMPLPPFLFLQQSLLSSPCLFLPRASPLFIPPCLAPFPPCLLAISLSVPLILHIPAPLSLPSLPPSTLPCLTAIFSLSASTHPSLHF